MMKYCYCHIVTNFFIILLTLTKVHCDTIANCTYQDSIGVWELYIDESWPACKQHFFPVYHRSIELKQPQLAVDKYGNLGEWTLVYNQGIEVTISHRKWFAFFDCDSATKQSFCDKSMLGTTHDTLNRQWFCFMAQKAPGTNLIPHKRPAPLHHPKPAPNVHFKANHDFVNRINAIQNSWKAVHYKEHEKLTLADIERRQGGFRSTMHTRPRQLQTQNPSMLPNLSEGFRNLPDSFDWRHPPNGGPSPVTVVRAQGNCGSCYAFASTAMLESRVRLASNFTEQPILSPQDVVECNPYSQGCDGGFPYLTAGKYAEDYGMVLEECNLYKGVDSPQCTTKENCTRYYATDYKYLGGYYGGCSEYLMKLELVEHGPFAVGFEVYPDFKHYKSGVYHHTYLVDKVNKFNPFELTNHAVLVVGYGVDNITSEPYWTVKNSWGMDWGEDGFFRIRRGSDECAIESIAVSVDPVL